MCLTVFIESPSEKNPDIHFVIGFNRDEQTQRRTIPFGQFEDDPNIWAGQDEISKGTWLGVNIYTGVFAILTNFSYEKPIIGKSRGSMMHQILSSKLVQDVTKQNVDQAINQRLKQILSIKSQFSPFNLVVYNIRTRKLRYICTEKKQMFQPKQLLSRKTYGLCNGYIDDIWPKTDKAMKLFDRSLQMLEKAEIKNCMDSIAELFKDRQKFSDNPINETSIFIDPYFNTRQQAQRMTKSTFVGVFIAKQNRIDMQYRQITYKPKTLEQSIVEGKLAIMHKTMKNSNIDLLISKI